MNCLITPSESPYSDSDVIHNKCTCNCVNVVRLSRHNYNRITIAEIDVQ